MACQELQKSERAQSAEEAIEPVDESELKDSLRWAAVAAG
jgi:hypothetical protein